MDLKVHIHHMNEKIGGVDGVVFLIRENKVMLGINQLTHFFLSNYLLQSLADSFHFYNYVPNLNW